MTGLGARRLATQRSFYEALGGRHPAEGVFASLVPAAPRRSLFNAVLYEDAATVPPLLGELAASYEAAGVRAWTVWVLPGDGALAATLAAEGHRLDATPEAMGAVLGDLDLDGPDLGEPARWEDVIDVNAAAYGVPAPELEPMRLAGDAVLLYAAEAAAIVLAVHDHDGDAGITYVAARPEARGRGLVASLLRQALRDAAGRGCTTTTLEATKLGRPVYERVGYEALGTLQMWERRREG